MPCILNMSRMFTTNHLAANHIEDQACSALEFAPQFRGLQGCTVYSSAGFFSDLSSVNNVLVEVSTNGCQMRVCACVCIWGLCDSGGCM